MNINKNLIQINHTEMKRNKSDIQWIVIHYVGALGDAKANTDYYKSTYVGASADFWIGHTGDIWQGNDYWNYYSWHCGGGTSGTYFGICKNSNSVGIEMCVKKRSTATMNATDKDWYFEDATVESAAKLVAYLMKELDIDISHVIRHYDVTTKICPNPFVYNNGNTTWDEFKNKIAEYAGVSIEITGSSDLYFVGTGWKDGKCENQHNSFSVYQNATKDADAAKSQIRKTYYVFDSNGNVKYTSEYVASNGTTYIDFDGLTDAQCAEKILEMARPIALKYGRFPSVLAAQCILESGFCRTTELVQKGNNCAGMKCDLLNSQWSGSTWDGVSKIQIYTPEDYGNGIVYIYDWFRKYDCLEDCMSDKSAFFSSLPKYVNAGFLNAKNYKEEITIVKNCGYATDQNYILKICSIIEKYGLNKFDGEKTGQVTDVKSESTTTMDKEEKHMYYVRKSFDNKKSQLGAFSVLSNATSLVDKNNGFFVYDENGVQVYPEDKTESTPSTSAQNDNIGGYYRVAKKYSNKTYSGQVGAYTSRQNAIKKAQETKLKAYDPNGTLIADYTVATTKSISSIPQYAVDWAVNIANDNSHGYDHTFGSDYDCSKLTIQAYHEAFKNAGVSPTPKDLGATRTADMYQPFIDAGFKDVTSSVNLNSTKDMVVGDVLLGDPHTHVETYIGNGMLVGALGDYDGKPGDSSGLEIVTHEYGNFGIRYVLRYPEEKNYRVQLGVFSVKSNATALYKKVTEAFPQYKFKNKLIGTEWNVYANYTYQVKSNATKLANEIKKKKINAMVVEI